MTALAPASGCGHDEAMDEAAFGTLLDQAAELVERARAAGADVAEAVVRQGVELAAKVRLGEAELVEEASHHSAGLRVIRGSRVALTATSDLSPSGIERVVRDALELAELSQPDPFAGPADPSEIAAGPFADLDLYDPSIESIDAEQAIAEARAAEQAARDFDPRITNMQGTTCGIATGASAMVLSGGFRSVRRSSAKSISCVAVADDADGKKRREGWSEARRHAADLPAASTIGAEAARRTVSMLGARKVPTCETAVVFPQETASSLLGLLASLLVGSAVWRKSSYLAGREGTSIASELVTVLDDPLIVRGLGSRAHDGEGLASRRNLVVDGGVLRTFLCDSYSARKLGRRSTASASRGASGGVGPGTTNFVLQPVPGMTQEEIVRSTPRGLLVTEMMGFGFNPTTGDFSRGASGFWIENGRLAYPVSEVTISASFDRLLHAIDAVASTYAPRSATLAPCLRVSSMIVSGN
ncbi:MAG TPA: metallopeptidase TldD-related protein [Polyangiaceae bacterium]|nr:metallopeptidase TldD-related protein [Polyangiaceae bacterium]